MLVLQVRKGVQIGRKVLLYAHRQVEQPSKRSEKNGDKSAVAMLKITRQLGCVFQDMESPKSSSFFSEGLRHTETDPMCEIHKKAVARHTDIRDQNPSLGMIC